MAKLDQVGICNLALTRVGQRRFITNISDDQLEAKVLKLNWDHCLLKALEELDWGFARKRDALAATAGTPPDEWGYEYGWPSDCVVPRFIQDGLKVRRADQRYPFRIEWNGSQRVIYCDVEDAVLVYTVEVTDTNHFSAHFTDSLAWRLAMEIAVPLSAKEKLVKFAAQMFEISIQRATRVEFETGEEPEQPDTPSLAARG